MNWKSVKLSDVCELINGRAYSQSELLDSGKYPVLRVGNFFTNKNWYFSDLELEDRKYCNFGDLLYAWSASFGPRLWQGDKSIFHYHIWKVEVNSNLIDKRFLYHFFDWDVDNIKKESGTGTTMIHVSKKSMDARIIKLPSIQTQQKIVIKIDAIFAEIDKAISAAEANAKNAEALFQSYLTEIFESGKDGWTQTKLKDIAEYFNGLTYSPKNVSDDGTIVLRSSNVQADKICLNDIVRVNSTIKDKLYVKNGDILMCSRNGSQRLVGKTATIDNLDEKMTFGTFMMIVRSENNFFIEWFFKSDLFKQQIVSGENTMINQITRYMLDEIVIPMPDLSTQKSISIKIGKLYEASQRLKISYLKKIEDLYAYKKSILKQAFNGELVKE